MKTTQIQIILALALLFVVTTATVSKATPMGTAFTYQGRLIDANDAAEGVYDFNFGLYDSASDGNQVGSDVNVPDVDVIDGYFTVALDFGSSVFAGDARWLEIGVRPGELEDPNGYTPLSPRQELTPTPYALHAGSDNDWMVSGNDMYSIPSGNVGVGESNPLAKLHVAGNVIVEGASPVLLSLSDLVGAGDVGVEFTTSLPGSKKWAMMRDGTSGGFLIQESFPYPPFLGGTLFMEAGTGNVGIGTKDPEKLLQIVNKEGGYDGLGITLDPHGGGFVGGSTWDIDNDDGAFKLTESRALPGYPKTRLTILEGNVGIGTTEPSHKLNVIGDANITGSLYAGTGSTVLFVDDGNDRVGIGTTNPRATLTINDNITNIYPGVPGLMIGNNGNSAIWVGKDSDNYGAFEWIDPYLRIWSEQEVRFALGGQQDKIVFDSSGNVGIGTTDPGAAKLKVSGGVLDMSSQKITNVADPTGNQDAATKKYVDDNVGIPSLKTYDSGWFAISTNTTYSKTHNLGTTKVIAVIYVATDISGSNMGLPQSNSDEIMLVSQITTTTCALRTKSYIASIWNGSSWVNGSHARIIMLALE